MHLVALAAVVRENKPGMLSMLPSVRLGMHLIISVRLLMIPLALGLLGSTHGGVVPAGIQVVLVALIADTLSAPADKEETTGSDTEANDDESENWDSDHYAQI